jgi:hypothetical protein
MSTETESGVISDLLDTLLDWVESGQIDLTSVSTFIDGDGGKFSVSFRTVVLPEPGY